MHGFPRYGRTRLVLVALLWLTLVDRAECARPGIARLLPKNTAAVLYVANVPETARALDKTTYADVMHDQSLRPLLRKLQSVSTPWQQQIEERLGSSVSELLQLPQNDIALAVFSLDQSLPMVAIFVDIGEKSALAQRTVEHVELQLLNTGANYESREVRGTTVSVFKLSEEPPQQLTICRREQTVVVTSDVEAVEAILARWDGQHTDDRLADSQDYRDALQHARVPREPDRGAFAYVHPLELYRAFTADNFAARTALTFVPTLGLDGVRGIGANLELLQRPFDSVLHVHLVLDQPRRGVVRAVALDRANIDPPTWVPDDVTMFQTFRWDFEKSAHAIRQAMAEIQGEEAWTNFVVEPISSRLGVDFEKEILSAWTGHVVRLSWYEEPSEATGDESQDVMSQLQRESTVVSMQVRDPEQFQHTLQQVIDHAGEWLRHEEYQGVVIYSTDQPDREQAREPEPVGQEQERRRRRRRRRTPGFAMALFQDQMIFSNRASAVERLIDQDELSRPLAELPEFQAALDAARTNFGGGRPMALTFQNTDRLWDYRWSLLRSQTVLDSIKENASENDDIMAIVAAVEEHPLPPWSQMRQYIGPSISVVADGEHGVHYTQYRLRPPGNPPRTD